MKKLFVGLTVISFVFGCGGGDGSVKISQLGEEMGPLFCERLFECCDSEELMEELGFFDVENENECGMVYAGFIGGFLEPTLQDAVDSGRLVYHGDRMADCMDAIASMSCSDYARVQVSEEGPAFEGCEDPFEGQVSDGDPCADDTECQSDHCIGDSRDFEGNVTEGVCGDPPGEGDACDQSSCGDGFYCEFGPEGEACTPRKSAGAECFSSDECDTGNCDDPDSMDSQPGTCSADYSCDGS